MKIIIQYNKFLSEYDTIDIESYMVIKTIKSKYIAAVPTFVFLWTQLLFLVDNETY